MMKLSRDLNKAKKLLKNKNIDLAKAEKLLKAAKEFIELLQGMKGELETIITDVAVVIEAIKKFIEEKKGE